MLRKCRQVQGLPFYHDEREFLRMELVYESDRTILPLDLTNDSLVLASRPFVLVSGGSAKGLFAGKDVQIEYIDTFDNNWRQPDHKRYNRELVKEVAIIR